MDWCLRLRDSCLVFFCVLVLVWVCAHDGVGLVVLALVCIGVALVRVRVLMWARVCLGSFVCWC